MRICENCQLKAIHIFGIAFVVGYLLYGFI